MSCSWKELTERNRFTQAVQAGSQVQLEPHLALSPALTFNSCGVLNKLLCIAEPNSSFLKEGEKLCWLQGSMKSGSVALTLDTGADWRPKRAAFS